MNFKQNFLVLIFSMLSLSLSAQLIIQKNRLFGINDLKTGDPLVAAKYDSIYQLHLRPRVIDNNFSSQPLPIFVCLKNQQFQLYNAHTSTFFEGVFDELKLYRQIDEQSHGLNPPSYLPYWVDCFMLRSGGLWGYIAYKKEYSLHDELAPEDSFLLIRPKYKALKFVEEQYGGYDSKKYTRTRRLLAAKKDSLWGAIQFETGQEIVPFKYPLPIHTFNNSYDNRGFEFLSTTGGFIPYYVARTTYYTVPQIIINPQHADSGFVFDYCPQIDIYNEFSKQYLYAEPKEDSVGFFKLYDYNTGQLLLAYERNWRYRYFKTLRPIENILIIEEATPYEHNFKQTWFNLSTGKILLLAEGKNYHATEFKLSKANELKVLKGKKRVGVILGEGSAMHIVWTTAKSYEP